MAVKVKNAVVVDRLVVSNVVCQRSIGIHERLNFVNSRNKAFWRKSVGEQTLERAWHFRIAANDLDLRWYCD